MKTHDSVVGGVPENDSVMPGSATEMIVTSIATRNIDTEVMNSVCQARAGILP